jgi:hypothetical protein
MGCRRTYRIGAGDQDTIAWRSGATLQSRVTDMGRLARVLEIELDEASLRV